MGFSARCRYWFILQVVVIVLCYSVNVSSTTKIAQSCVGSRLDLRCSSTKVIKIQSIYRGISSCKEATCCIRDADCTQTLSEEYERSVRNRCDDQQHCTVDIPFEKLPCKTYSWWWGEKTIDGHAYEKITYACSGGPGILSAGSTTSSPLRADSTDENILYTTEKFPEDETTNDNVRATADNVTSTAETIVKFNETNIEADGKDDGRENADELNSQIQPVVMVIIGVVLLITVVVVVVVIYRRRKLPQPNLLHPVEMRDVDSSKNETAIYANETQVNSPHENNDFLYTTICKADLPKTEADPTLYTDVEVLKLDRNQMAKSNAAHNAINLDQNTGPDVYAVLNKTSDHAAKSSALKSGVSERQGRKGHANPADGFPDQTNESEGAADMYCNESFAVSSNRSEIGTVLKPPSPQDDGGLTVIENDLYCH